MPTSLVLQVSDAREALAATQHSVLRAHQDVIDARNALLTTLIQSQELLAEADRVMARR